VADTNEGLDFPIPAAQQRALLDDEASGYTVLYDSANLTLLELEGPA
jgi:hypothetical protein